MDETTPHGEDRVINGFQRGDLVRGKTHGAGAVAHHELEDARESRELAKSDDINAQLGFIERSGQVIVIKRQHVCVVLTTDDDLIRILTYEGTEAKLGWIRVEFLDLVSRDSI